MKARASKPHRTIRAFTGRLFVSYEWRPVPVGSEDEAERLAVGGYLDLKPEVQEASIPAPVVIEATPAAIALAKYHSIDLAAVAGTGKDRRITVLDVRMAVLDEEE
jgi:pyruvate/2-oxoglutarate dehydrogenase complex dihydrolipoamide acyltransferase (E2) component